MTVLKVLALALAVAPSAVAQTISSDQRCAVTVLAGQLLDQVSLDGQNGGLGEFDAQNALSNDLTSLINANSSLQYALGDLSRDQETLNGLLLSELASFGRIESASSSGNDRADAFERLNDCERRLGLTR